MLTMPVYLGDQESNRHCSASCDELKQMQGICVCFVFVCLFNGEYEMMHFFQVSPARLVHPFC